MEAFGQPNDDASTLWSQATLYRDAWGVPHVYGDNPRALAFAFGYAQAEDHLAPMLLAYRMANGRAAEVLGEPYAESDAFSLKMGHAHMARMALQNADPITRDLCEGFALGVNAWILDNADKAPAWAEGVQPQDVLALWHAFIMSMAPFDIPATYRRPRAFHTANAWALAPGRTVENKTTLVINPHQYYDGPFRWYEAHLVLDEYNMAGATLFGLPVIVQGHNETLGWAFSPNKPDFADIFTQNIAGPKPDPNDPSFPKLDLSFMPMMMYLSQSQTYHVRTDNGLEARRVPVHIGALGPTFESGTDTVLSWRIGGYAELGGLRQLIEMGRARDLEAFQDALRLRQIPCFHIVYADRGGNIFYLYNAHVQDATAADARRAPLQVDVYRKAPIPVEAAATMIGPAVALESLPHLLNPRSGYIQACGNPPWNVTGGVTINPGNWPDWLVEDTDSYRAKRARQLLGTGRRSFRDNQSMLYDVVVPAALEIAPLLGAMAEKQSQRVSASHPDLAAGLALLRDWNYVADTHSEAMTFYRAWWARLETLGGTRFPSDTARYAALLSNSPEAQEWALSAAADAARLMRNEFQSLSVLWGDAHRIHRGNRSEAIFGSGVGEPLFLASDDVYDGGQWHVNYGYGFAMVVQFGDTPEAVSIVPFGASENPASPHFDDQLDLLLEKRFKRTRFTNEDVWRYAQTARGRRIVLRPLDVEGTVSLDADAPILARLLTSQQPPAPPPEGAAAFSPFIRPEYAPQRVPLRIQVSIRVPEPLCETEALGELALYVHDSEHGWRRTPRQPREKDPRTFSGAYNATGTFAVLGPAALRADVAADAGAHTGAPISPESPGAAAPPKDAAPPEAAPPEAEAQAVDPGPTPPAQPTPEAPAPPRPPPETDPPADG